MSVIQTIKDWWGARRDSRTSGANAGMVTKDAVSQSLFEIIAGTDAALGGVNVAYPYESSVYVFAAICNPAQAIAGLPVRLYKADDDPVWDHEYLDLLAEPNPEQTGEELLEALLTHKGIDGIAYLVEPEFELGGRQGRREIWVASQSEITPLEVNGVLVGYRYTPLDSNAQRTLTPDQVVASRYYHPRRRLEGLSPARVARLAIEGHTGALRLFRSAVRNGAELGAVFSTDKDLSEQQHKEQLKIITQRYSGPEAANRPLLLSGGVKVDRGSQGMNDINWLAGMGLAATMIGTVYRVPPIMLNLMDQAQYNSAPEQMRMFWSMNGLPAKRRAEAALNKIVLRNDRANYYFKLDTSDIQQLRIEEAEFAEKAMGLSKYIGINRIIERYDLGFETESWGDEPLVPAGNLPISVLVEEAKAALATETQPEGIATEGTEEIPATEDTEEEEKAVGISAVRLSGKSWRRIAQQHNSRIDSVLRTVAEVRGNVERAARQRATWLKWWRSWLGLRRDTQQVMRKYFEKQAAGIVARLRTEFARHPELAGFASDKALPALVMRAMEFAARDEGGAWLGERDTEELIRRFTQMDADPEAQGSRLKASGISEKVRADAEEIIEHVLFDLAEEDGKLRLVLQPKIEDGVELGAKQVKNELSSELTFDIEDPALKARIKDQAIKVGKINKTTRERIRRVLLKGLDGGDSLADLAEKINAAMGSTNSSRSFLIAQTEMHQAINVGRNESIAQHQMEKRWLTSGKPVRTKANPKGIVRSAHHHAQVTSAQGIGAHELFTLIDEDGRTERGQHPGDPKLSPANTINCSCVVVAKTGGKSDGGWERIGGYTYERMLAERQSRPLDI